MSATTTSTGGEGASERNARCEHCRTPVDPERAPSDGERLFCCVGCRAVHAAIQGAGLEGFYELRNDDGPAAPAPEPTERGAVEEFDTAPFLERYTEEHEDGTRSAQFHLQGVHCAGCVWLVERMPARLEGVVDARLHLGRSRLSVRWRPDAVDLSKIGRWLEQFGYVPRPVGESGASDEDRAQKRMLRRVGVCWAIAANVMLLAFALYSGLEAGSRGGLFGAFRWLSFGLTSGAVAYGGSVFFRRAWASVRPILTDPGSLQLGQLSIDIPISFGILAGYLHSTAATFAGTGEVWFDSVAVLIAALLTARWLQMRGQMLARESTERLFRMLPMTARRVDGDGEVATVPVEELSVGDVVEVRPSEKVPVDGRVCRGSTRVQTGALTGESRPERIECGDRVFAGSENVGSRIRLEAETTAEESRVGKLRSWIDEKGVEAPSMVRRADRWAGAFVLLILVAAVAVWAGWSAVGSEAALRYAVALLVIACPCALGMATPLAMTVGVGRAARRGIFVKDDAVFEKLRDLELLVVDKTGTVTRGEMDVVEWRGSTRALRRAAALEYDSQHPVGRALRAWGEMQAESLGRPEDVAEHPGDGVVGRVGGSRIEVGRPDWVVERARSGAEAYAGFLDRAARAGYSPVAVAVDGEVAAVAALGDPVRERAAELLDTVRKAGVEVVMLSGDHPGVVREVAGELGLPHNAVAGDVSPERKREFVRARNWESSPRATVGFLGDGVNDAAAMQAADVGIAVDGSADPSVVAADVFVARRGLGPLFELWSGAEGVLGTVRRNVAMSGFYNVAAVGAAAGGLVSPLAAAIAMPLSSIAVVLSSVLQRPFQGLESTGSEEATVDRGARGANESRREGADLVRFAIEPE